LGLSDIPEAGELFTVSESERKARLITEERQQQILEAKSQPRTMSLDQVYEAFQAGETQELRLVIKVDAQGSIEPITSSLGEISAGEIKVNVLHAATGNISENDVMLATASDAIVIGFNVVADQAAQRAAESEGVDIRIYDIIYRLTEDIEKALKGMLEPEIRRVVLGRAEVRAVFHIPKVGKIAGCMVLEGELRRNAKIRVLRGEEVIWDSPIASLKHVKDDVREIREGFECGVGVRGFEKFEVDDILECYTEETVAVE
jgi:translation initiation factor IF-2